MSHLGGGGAGELLLVVVVVVVRRESRRPAWSYWVRGWGSRKETRAEWKALRGEAGFAVGWGAVGAFGLG